MLRVSTGGLDAAMKLDQNKRNKGNNHDSPEYSGASSDSHFSLGEVFLREKSLMLQTNCVSSSPLSQDTLEEQVPFAEELGAAVVDTSFWSTDNDNAGDDEYSRDGTSTFNSSEEDFSQQGRQYHEPFLPANRNIYAFDQADKQTDNSWSGSSNLLQLKLGSFIHREEQKLESEFEEGSSGLNKNFPSGTLQHEYESMEPVTVMHNERSSGSSGLLSGILGDSSFLAEINQARYRDGMIHSSHASSMLLSCVRNKKMNGFDFPMNKEEESKKLDTKVPSEEEERIFLNDNFRGVRCLPFSSAQSKEKVYKMHDIEVHRTFVLSSGRPSHVKAAREVTRASTIDRDFDDYFAQLML